MPFSRPRGSMVPSAVVEGKRMLGFISLMSDSKKTVCSAVPAGKCSKGVSFAGIKGPIPHISGENSSMNLRSFARVFSVWKGEPTINPQPT